MLKEHKKGGREMRRKFLRGVACAALLLCACNRTEVQAKTVNVDNLYIMETVVYEFDYETDEVVCETETGNLYAFYGIEDWELGDRCILVMDNCGTENIKDDEIIRTFYRR